MTKRKTYSIDPLKAQVLAQASLDMSKTLNKTIGRQDILDVLVGLLVDKTIYKKVSTFLK